MSSSPTPSPPAKAVSPDLPVALPPGKPSIGKRAAGSVGRSYKTLPLWKKLLLVVVALLIVVGVVGSIVGTMQPSTPEQNIAAANVESIRIETGRSSLTAEQREQLDQQLDDAKTKLRAAGHWFYDKTAPNLWRWGLAFFAGFVLGFAFRQFIKTMAILAAVVIVAAGIAAYLGYIDVGALKTNVTSGTGWFMDRVGAIKDVVIASAGASLIGTAGFVIGFMRK